MGDDVLRLRATVVSEEALANLKALWREVGAGPMRAGKGVKEIDSSFGALGKTIKGVGSELKAAVPSLGAFGLGAAGVGLAARTLIGTLGDISAKIVQMKYASKELGMTEQALRGFSEAAQKAGIAPEAMTAGLQSFKRNTEDIKNRMGELRGELYAMGAGDFVNRVKNSAEQIDALKEAFDFKEALNKSDPSGVKARRFFEMIGLGASAARLSWDELSETIKNKKVLSEADQAAAKKFNDLLISLGENWDMLKVKFGVRLIPVISRDLEDLSKIVDKLGELDAWISKKTGKGGGEPGAAPAPGGEALPWWLGMTLPGRLYNLSRKGLRAFSGDAGAGEAPPAEALPTPRRGTSGFKPISFGGFSNGGDGGEQSSASRIVQTGVFDALVEFQSYAGAGGTGGGFTNASYGGAASARGDGTPIGNAFAAAARSGGTGPSGATAPGGQPSGATAPGGQQTYAGGSDKQKTAQTVANELRAQGVPENVIAGMMANIQSESGFDPSLRHADQPKFGGEAHYAHGLFQEGGAEWNTWAKDMQSRGLDPNTAWKDPKEQARFVAGRLKGTIGDKSYASLWKRMTAPGVTKEQAAEMFVRGYLKPAQRFQDQRSQQYRKGVPGVEHYTGPGKTDAGPGVPAAPGGGRVTHEGTGKMVSPEIREAMEYAGAKAGVRTNIAHGDEGGHARHRPGASAGDVDLYDTDGRKLDSRIPADRAKMAAYIEAAAAGGASGIGMGSGSDYMGPSRMHIGGGAAAVWGAKGKGANAPSWVRAAYERGRKNQVSPAQRRAVIDAGRIDQANSPRGPNGQVNVTVNSNGTKADTAVKNEGDLFQGSTVRQHKQMQRTEDAGEVLSI